MAMSADEIEVSLATRAAVIQTCRQKFAEAKSELGQAMSLLEGLPAQHQDCDTAIADMITTNDKDLAANVWGARAAKLAEASVALKAQVDEALARIPKNI